MQSLLFLTMMVLVVSCTLASNVSLTEEWNFWKRAHNKHYVRAEEHLRQTIWERNLKIVEEHNAQADLGLHTYWLKMNQYADLTVDEFVKVFNGLNGRRRGEHDSSHRTDAFDRNAQLPDTVDWRSKGVVTSVKDQGQCDSSWAFSAVGSIEGAYAIKTGRLVSLPVDQLINCSGPFGTRGCNGGLVDQAFQYIINASGYPCPHPVDCKPCRFNGSSGGVKLCGYTDLPSKSEDALQDAVANIGPISVTIDAAHTSFQLYKSGVYNERACSQTRLDQSVLVVGYGTLSEWDYWLVKNSWSVSWGNRGYIMMARNKENQCGIATMASYPIVC